jgi:hypothetical protein
MTAEEGHRLGLEAAAALTSTDVPTTPATPEAATPQVADTTETATAPADSFTRIDPTTLPPELRPFYDSMQGDYTRKTQEIAPYRQLAQDTGLDVEGLRQSAELYSALQDPSQLVQFHTELTDALQAQGLTPAQAAAAATQHVTEVQQGGGVTPDAYTDPEEQRFQDLTSRLDRFEQSQAQEAQQRQNEMRAGQVVAEMNRQEMVIKESHPTWGQEDIDATYELSAFYGGNLIQAASRYDEIVSNKVAAILNGKGAAASNPALSPLPAAVPGLTRGTGFGDDLNAAHKAAMAAARALPQ